MWPFRRRSRRPVVTAAELAALWLQVVVPEGVPDLDTYEAGLSDAEREGMRKTLAKLAADGVERIFQVRKVDLEPDRAGLARLGEIVDPALRYNLSRDQSPSDPHNLFRRVVLEFGAVTGEIFRRSGKGEWDPRRAPNHWRSEIVSPSGARLDPFALVVRQLSDERTEAGFAGAFDAFA